MSKISLLDVGSIAQNPISAANTINNNNDTIVTAIDNTLSLDGTSPNKMGSTFDMNSNRIINLPAPVGASEPLRFQDLSDFIGGGTISNIPAGGATGQVLAKQSSTDFDINWNNTVSSVALALPNDFSVTGSPVTTTGTLTAAWVNTPTGTGGVVRQTSPTLISPALGTPVSGIATNLTGTAAGLTAGNVTTNANLTGVITSVGNATSIASQTGTGTKFVVDTTPTLVTPVLGVATATTINKVTITAPVTSAVLTIPDGVTFTGPAVSGTAMTLGNVETVTGAKTFGAAGNVGKLIVAGTTSGTTIVNATATASGTLILPAATDTLVGKATTDTLTNKTYDTAGTGNSFSINGVAATANTGTGSVVRATGPTLSAPLLGTPASGVLTNCTGLPLSGLTTQAAYTVVANNTGGTAVPTAMDITAITAKASPVAGDIVLIQDSAASNAFKRTTVGALSSAGSVASINGQTGALVSYYPPQGRVTLTTVVPVMTSTVSGATTVYYTPYVGNMVPIYDGTNMIPTAVAEISQATTDTTKSPAAVAASKVYDIFVWNDSGTLRATRGPAWTNSTTRGYTFTMVNGILLNTSSITNGPAASRGTWVGTIASNGSSTIDYIFGGSASGGTAAVLNVWNTYNRVLTTTTVIDSGTSYTYSGVCRQARASTGNQVGFTVGTIEDAVQATYFAEITLSTGTNAAAAIGLGTSTSSFSGGVFAMQINSATVGSPSYAGCAAAAFTPTLGSSNVISANERGVVGTESFNINDYTFNTLTVTIRN